MWAGSGEGRIPGEGGRLRSLAQPDNKCCPRCMAIMVNPSDPCLGVRYPRLQVFPVSNRPPAPFAGVWMRGGEGS